MPGKPADPLSPLQEASAIKKGVSKYDAQLAKLAREQASCDSVARREKEQA